MESNSLTAMIATEHYMHMYDVEKIFFSRKVQENFLCTSGHEYFSPFITLMSGFNRKMGKHFEVCNAFFSGCCHTI